MSFDITNFEDFFSSLPGLTLEDDGLTLRYCSRKVFTISQLFSYILRDNVEKYEDLKTYWPYNFADDGTMSTNRFTADLLKLTFHDSSGHRFMRALRQIAVVLNQKSKESKESKKRKKETEHHNILSSVACDSNFKKQATVDKDDGTYQVWSTPINDEFLNDVIQLISCGTESRHEDGMENSLDGTESRNNSDITESVHEDVVVHLQDGTESGYEDAIELLLDDTESGQANIVMDDLVFSNDFNDDIRDIQEKLDCIQSVLIQCRETTERHLPILDFVKPELMRLLNDPLKSEVFEDQEVEDKIRQMMVLYTTCKDIQTVM